MISWDNIQAIIIACRSQQSGVGQNQMSTADGHTLSDLIQALNSSPMSSLLASNSNMIMSARSANQLTISCDSGAWKP